MAISRTPKNENDNPDFITPTAQIFEDVDNELGNNPAPKTEADERYEKLAQQMADLQRDMLETQRANMALITQPQQWKSQVDQLTEVKPESIALPDPAIDPDGYANATQRRIELTLANDRRRNERAANEQTEIRNKVDDLWSSFSEKYEDYAADQEKVDFISTKLVNQAKARGVDVKKYMFITQDKFMGDVVREYNNVFGSPEGDEDDHDERDSREAPRRSSSRSDTRNRSRSRNRESEETMGRTGGIFGGNESGGRASGRRHGDDDLDNGQSMIDDIQALQRKTGFF